MKSLVRGVAIGLAVVLGTQALQAQTAVSLGMGGGAAVPTGTLADGSTTGWSSEIVARVKPAASPVGLQVDGFYNRFGLAGGVDGNSRLIGSTANAVFTFPIASKARPYLIGGVGVYNGQTSITGQPSTASAVVTTSRVDVIFSRLMKPRPLAFASSLHASSFVLSNSSMLNSGSTSRWYFCRMATASCGLSNA